MTRSATERLVDNVALKRREAWSDAHSKTEPLAWIAVELLQDPKWIGWTSEWSVNRWKPEMAFGRFR